MTAPGGSAGDPRPIPLPIRSAQTLVVAAHPDDESFGLGAVVAALSEAGTEISVVCFTHGEASTLGGAGGTGSDLGAIRSGELAAAARELGVARCELLDFPDGGLAGIGIDVLAAHVLERALDVRADTLLVFDLGGVTGHPDHQRATEAALAAAEQLDVDVVAWAIPDEVARALNAEFSTSFVGRAQDEGLRAMTVDRRAQRAAIACHASQSSENPVLRRRIELLGDREHVRWLRRRSTA